MSFFQKIQEIFKIPKIWECRTSNFSTLYLQIASEIRSLSTRIETCWRLHVWIAYGNDFDMDVPSLFQCRSKLVQGFAVDGLDYQRFQCNRIGHLANHLFVHLLVNTLFESVSNRVLPSQEQVPSVSLVLALTHCRRPCLEQRQVPYWKNPIGENRVCTVYGRNGYPAWTCGRRGKTDVCNYWCNLFFATSKIACF